MSLTTLLVLSAIIFVEVAVGLVLNARAYRRDRARQASNRAAGYNGVVAIFTDGKLAILKIRFVQLLCCFVLALTPFLNPERMPAGFGSFLDVWRAIVVTLAPYRLGAYTAALMVVIFLIVLAIIRDELTFHRARVYQSRQAVLLGLLDERASGESQQDGTEGRQTAIDESGRGV